MASFLRSLDRSAVSLDPFPHIYVEDLLDASFCRDLAASVPPIRTFNGGSAYPDNYKLNRGAADLLNDPTLSDIWRAIIEEHLTSETLADAVRLFMPDIEREYGRLAQKLTNLESMRIGVRHRDKKCDILMDALFIMHTPIKGAACAERGPHVKGPNKLFESAFCLRQDGDVASGGDLVLHRVHNDRRPVYGSRMQIDRGFLTATKVIPRKRNAFVFWMNTPGSVTELTPRDTSEYPSPYFNFLVEFPRNLFRLPGVHRGARFTQTLSHLFGR